MSHCTRNGILALFLWFQYIASYIAIGEAGSSTSNEDSKPGKHARMHVLNVL